MTHTVSPPSEGGHTDARRLYYPIGRVPRELFITGQWTPSGGGRLEVVNPATEDVIADVADATVDA